MVLGDDSEQIRRARTVLSRSVPSFWSGGAGSTHDELNRLFELQGIDPASIDSGSKRTRVASALVRCPDEVFFRLVEALVEDLLSWESWPLDLEPREGDQSTEYRAAWDSLQEYAKDIDLLASLLRPFGYSIDRENGSLQGESPYADPHESVFDIQQRLKRATEAEDPSLVVGTAKDLIEAVAKHVLHEVGESVDRNEDLPGLVARTQEALGLHAKQMNDGVVGKRSRKVLGGLQQIVIGIIELRNAAGSGHGTPRGQQVRLSMRHARLASGAASVWTQMVLDTLRDRQAERLDEPTQ